MERLEAKQINGHTYSQLQPPRIDGRTAKRGGDKWPHSKALPRQENMTPLGGKVHESIFSVDLTDAGSACWRQSTARSVGVPPRDVDVHRTKCLRSIFQPISTDGRAISVSLTRTPYHRRPSFFMNSCMRFLTGGGIGTSMHSRCPFAREA